MAINVQQGTPGSGKSAVAVARAIAHLRRGGVVAANFRLVDGWADVVARQGLWMVFLRFLNLFRPGLYESAVYQKARCLYSRLYHVDSVNAIMEVFPKRDAVGAEASKEGVYKEGQGLLLLDEAQLIFNARNFQQNFKWIEFFTQHRKLGWNVLLIAHDIEMIDKQIRPLCEYESRFRNLQKIRIPVLDLPLSPFPMFLVITRYAGLGAGASTICARAMYPLPLWAARLYDSCLVFSADKWTGVDSLPTLCGPAPVPPSGTGAAPPRRRRLVGPHWDDLLQTIPGESYALEWCDIIDLTDIVEERG